VNSAAELAGFDAVDGGSGLLMLPFATTGSKELLEAMPPHETAHAALVSDIAGVIRIIHNAGQ
jgi:hypothetical protein